MTIFIKDVSGNSDPGDATHWGGNDIMFLDKYFGDVDISPKVPTINTLTKWRSGKLAILNPARTFRYLLVAGAIAADVNLNIPILGADDTIVCNTTAATLTNKNLTSATNTLPSNVPKTDATNTFTVTQKVDEEIQLKKQTVYNAAASGYYGLFFDNADNKLKKIDSSGTITNIEGGSNPLYPDNSRKYGILGVTATGGPNTIGLLDNGTQTGTVAQGNNTTDGFYMEWPSGAANGDNAGYHIPAVLTYRKFNPLLYVRFALPNQSSTTRAYLGFTSSTVIPAGDDELNAKSGIMMYKTNGGNFRIGSNDGSGATAFTADLAVVDSNTHTVIIKGDEANTKWQYSWDGAAFVDLVANTPASTTGLSVVLHVETGTTSSRTIRIFDAKLATDK